MQPDQHDDHVWLTVLGRNCRIYAVRRGFILLFHERKHRCDMLWIRASGIDWATYATASRRKLLWDCNTTKGRPAPPAHLLPRPKRCR